MQLSTLDKSLLRTDELELNTKKKLNASGIIAVYDTEIGQEFKLLAREFATSPNYVILVQSSEDLQGDLRSDVIYLIDGEIDMGTTSVVVPEGGLNISGLSGGREVSCLYSNADNYTMFISNGTSGGMYVEEITFCGLTGTGSKLFNLTNNSTGAFEFQNVNFGGFGANNYITSLGELTSYRQLFFSGCGFYFVNDGFTLNGDFGGMVLQDSNVINPTTAATLFSEGTTLTFDGSVRSNVNFNSVNAAGVAFDFQASNFDNKAAFSLNNFRTTATNAVPNITGASSYARFRNCDGIKNTYVGGQWYISSTAVTTIGSISTPVKIAGTTVYADMQWFTQSTDNAFVYDGNQTIEVEVKGNLSFTGTNGDVINVYVRQWDDSASSYIDLSETAGSTLNASGRAEGVAFNGIGTLDNGDRIELWVENETAARNVTAQLNGYVILSERAS